jgi:predicted polyphosphate/ATP-dependent NAD kinase
MKSSSPFLQRARRTALDDWGTGAGHREGPLMGLIVNPLAGLGGPVGLKGSDGEDVVCEALRRGAVPVAEQKAAEALARLAALIPTLHVIAAGGAMGEGVAREAGFLPRVVHRPHEVTSTPGDTISAAAAMADHQVDLILFAGGDGTARDILAAVGDRVPVLGVPAGVKMHSAVFGTSAKNAGLLAASFLAHEPTTRLRDAEVMDLDEDAIRADRVSARLFGYARSPYERRLAQNAKAGAGPGEDAALDATTRQVASAMRSGRLYILGPGTTTRRVSDALTLPSTLLGVDAVLDGAIVGLDVGERELLRLMEGRESHIIVGVLGGQGSLFGRGNQQISAEVIRRTGRERITVIASIEKLIALAGAPLRVDTGSAEIDAMLSGHLHVETAPGRRTPVRVVA